MVLIYVLFHRLIEYAFIYDQRILFLLQMIKSHIITTQCGVLSCWPRCMCFRVGLGVCACRCSRANVWKQPLL